MLKIADCAGAGAATALLCAIGLPAGSLVAYAAWAFFVFCGLVAIIGFAWGRLAK
jgi:hypothetical protein